LGGGNFHLDLREGLFFPQGLVDGISGYIVRLGHLGQGPGRVGLQTGGVEPGQHGLAVQAVFLADVRKLAPAKARRRVLGQAGHRTGRRFLDHFERFEHAARGHAVLMGDFRQGLGGGVGLDVAQPQQGQGLFLIDAHASGKALQRGALGLGIGGFAVDFGRPFLEIARQGHHLSDGRHMGQGGDEHEEAYGQSQEKGRGENHHFAVFLAQMVEQGVPVEDKVGHAGSEKKQPHAQMRAFPARPGQAEKGPIRPVGHAGRWFHVHDHGGQYHEK